MFGKLSDLRVRGAKPREKVYKLSDGNMLELVIFPTGTKTWKLSYSINKKRKTISLGEYPVVGLGQAREKALAVKTLAGSGVDPVAHRQQAASDKERVKEASGRTLETVAREWVDRFGKDWAPGHANKTIRRMELYLFPLVGKKLITELTPVNLLGCAKPLQSAGKTETAYRLLRTVSQVLRYCIANGYGIDRDITADLRGALPSAKTSHLAALTKPDDIAALLKSIDQFSGKNESVKNCLRLAPHVFLRPGELRGIKKSWVNLEKKEIVIPAGKMKTRVEHVVPLSAQASGIVSDALLGNDTEYLFPSPIDKTRAISNMSLLVALRRMGYSNKEMTAHGFRAMASTNLEHLGFDIRTIELQLAHADTNGVRAAYKRDTSRLQMPQRSKMMQEWSDWLCQLDTMPTTD